MTPLEALHLQLRLEGMEILDGNRLRQVEVVPDEDMPLMILAHLADTQTVAYYDASLREDRYRELIVQTQHAQFPAIDPILKNLSAHNISFYVGHYKTYLFPTSSLDFISWEVDCRSKSDPRVQDFGFGDFVEHVYVVEREGRIASACVSTRENEECGEAWVYTDPQYCNQGLARQVVSAWAKDLLTAGKVPFYSHKIANIASAHLARRLGLEPTLEEIVISNVHKPATL